MASKKEQFDEYAETSGARIALARAVVALSKASLKDGSLEFMVHRRLQADDNRGVQEPLNETMCGCNDINAAPGNMGEFGHEGAGRRRGGPGACSSFPCLLGRRPGDDQG